MSDQNRRYAPPMTIGLAGTTGLTAGRSPVVRFRSGRPQGHMPARYQHDRPDAGDMMSSVARHPTLARDERHSQPVVWQPAFMLAFATKTRLPRPEAEPLA